LSASAEFSIQSGNELNKEEQTGTKSLPRFQNPADSIQRQKHKYHMDDVDSSSDPGDRHETSEDEVASFTDLEPEDPITAIDSSVLDPSEIRDNIQIHLNYVYPLDQPRIHGNYRWISTVGLRF
jgi:hypothetical protein